MLAKDCLYSNPYLVNVITYNIKDLKINNKYNIGLVSLIFVDNVLSFFHFSYLTSYLSTDFETKYGLEELSKSEMDDYCYINEQRFPFIKKVITEPILMQHRNK